MINDECISLTMKSSRETRITKDTDPDTIDITFVESCICYKCITVCRCHVIREIKYGLSLVEHYLYSLI